eukprot:CAMPEP_0116141130 /NCGR_PEP_ID=MMETSP0329-20121206/14218_1 /TAXON_ID=697910 /ORGANISM="Pseudo-nitzschia arenysensis, Strain B593" /LENGTH=97 /DNA_ID=CAMNT_0003636293 /DNA_START=314 /DNA_END=603 /DNA_ORIENTATION=+
MAAKELRHGRLQFFRVVLSSIVFVASGLGTQIGESPGKVGQVALLEALQGGMPTRHALGPIVHWTKGQNQSRIGGFGMEFFENAELWEEAVVPLGTG